jgi:integrase
VGRIAKPVSEKRSAQLAKREGRHAIGDPSGLYLFVVGGGASWILRYMFAGRRRDMGLGSYGDLTLAEARETARTQRKLIKQGIDPLQAKREQLAITKAANAVRMTFKQCVTGYIDSHGDGWRNAKHRAQWQSTLDTYAAPVIGDIDVAKVDTPHVLKILEPIWKTKTETASRVRGRIESVLSWATVRKYRHGENPARWKGHLDQLLPKPSKVAKIEHHAALPYRDMGAFIVELRKQKGIGAAALEFAILTAARSGEVRGATWSEIDLDAKLWKIPGERMKAGKEHVVPLSDAAVAIVKRMEKERTNGWVFPGARDEAPLSDMSLTAVLRRMGRDDLTAHGFRSTFRDWAAECTAYPAEMAEMALAHTVSDKVEAAYRRGNMLSKRVRMMSDWAKWCAKPLEKDNVLSLKQNKRAAA